MAVPPAPGLDEGLTSSDPAHTSGEPARPGRGRFRSVLLAALVLVLLLAAAAVAFGVLGQDRRPSWLGSTGADETQREREAAMAQARQFMLRGQTYGPEGLDGSGKLADYRALVEEVVTPKFFTQFEQTATVAEQLVAQAGVERSAEVLGTGVETIDEDSATVLVAGEISMTTPAAAPGGQGGGQGGSQDEEGGTAEQTAPTRDLFRVVIEMVKVDGEWLVDDFAQASEAAQ